MTMTNPHEAVTAEIDMVPPPIRVLDALPAELVFPVQRSTRHRPHRAHGMDRWGVALTWLIAAPIVGAAVGLVWGSSSLQIMRPSSPAVSRSVVTTAPFTTHPVAVASKASSVKAKTAVHAPSTSASTSPTPAETPHRPAASVAHLTPSATDTPTVSVAVTSALPSTPIPSSSPVASGSPAAAKIITPSPVPTATGAPS